MKSLLVIVASHLLMIAVLGQMLTGTLAGVLWMFSLAFFDNLLGKKKTLAVVAAFSLWSVIDQSVPWAVQMMHSMTSSLGPPPNIEFQVTVFFTIFLVSGTFIGLLGWNLLQLQVVKYLVRRWRLKERCGKIYV